jgi:uncharacterized membrane protein
MIRQYLILPLNVHSSDLGSGVCSLTIQFYLIKTKRGLQNKMTSSGLEQKKPSSISGNITASNTWSLYSLYLLAALFTAVLFYFLVNKHNAFNTRTYDFARFGQAIWNVLHGHFLFSSIDYRSILGNHFSPYMALLSPLYLIWPNERVLFFIQAASVAAAGVFLALILYQKHPKLAFWFLLAFYLNPAVHSLTLFEFRRVVLVMPYLALALLALYLDKKLLMLAALFVALLGKEDIGLFVSGVGLFLLFIKRDFWWGLGLLLLGLGWSIIVSLWVIPAFRTPGSEYPQLFYFDYLGDSYGEMIATIRSDPLILFRQLFKPDRLAALGRLLLPLGFFLPFLGADWLLIALPPLLLLMLSGDPEMYGLLKWYPTAVLPVFFAATAVGISRFPNERARWLVVWLMVATAVGYQLFSPLPGGRNYEAALYEVTDHDRQGLEMVLRVPPDAAIAAQPHYVPHLIQRQQLFHYPWIKIGQEQVDYFLFDRQSDPYPFSADEFNHELARLLVDPAYHLVEEADDIYLLQQNSGVEPAFRYDETVQNSPRLYGMDIAQQAEDGFFYDIEGQPLAIEPGKRLRVILYWEALAERKEDWTMSVRLADESGWLFAQHDGVPGLGSLPTSWWQAGQKVQDIHYLDIPQTLPEQPLKLELLLYDSLSQDIISWADGNEQMELVSATTSAPK